MFILRLVRTDIGVASLRLYPFQKEALASLFEAARRARKEHEESGGKSLAIRAICAQPTAAGKTIEILYFVRELSVRWGWRALVIEPTRELVSQTIKKAERFTPDRKVSCAQWPPKVRRVVTWLFQLPGRFIKKRWLKSTLMSSKLSLLTKLITERPTVTMLFLSTSHGCD